MRPKRQRGQQEMELLMERNPGVRVVFALVAVLAAIRVDAQVFTKNQVLKKNVSPPTIPANYYTFGALTGPVPVGSPVHIVYAIQVTSNNTGASPVNVAVTLPTGFAPTTT